MSSLAPLHQTLTQLRNSQVSPSALASAFREAAQRHQPALPQRYHEVLNQLLSQLESSALFAEESCSFSQTDLIDLLADWLSKAEQLQQN
jgi:hypothetical protein